MTHRVADSLAERLAAAGVRHAFGIPGGEVLTLIDALARAGIEYIAARHETAAGLMAEGASFGTGAPGLLVLTVGPGVSNAVNAIANAYLDRVPLIVLSGAVDRERPGRYTHQVFDQRALLAPVVKASFVAEPDSVARSIAQAIELTLRHPRGPVHIEVPILNAVAEATPAPRLERARIGCPPNTTAANRSADDRAGPRRSAVLRAPQTGSLPLPGDRETAGRRGTSEGRLTIRGRSVERELLREAASWLASAARPLVLAGLEATEPPVASALAELVRALQLPLLTTYKAKGVLDENDPLSIGAVALSPKADALVKPLIDAADVILLVGYDPVEMRAGYAQPFSPDTKLIELAAARREHRMHDAQLQIVGDLHGTLSAMRGQLGDHPARARTDGLPTRVRASLRRGFSPAARGGFSPLAVSEVLARMLPSTAQLTIDTGAHRIVLSQVLRAQWPGQILQSNGLCTMGYALPCAMGLALASGRRVIAAMGDGGLEMVLGELATLRDLALPLTLVVFDDSSFALIDQKQHDAGLARRGVWLGSTDHVALATAFGGRGVRVHDRSSLERALADSLATTHGFDLISCALERGAYEGLL